MRGGARAVQDDIDAFDDGGWWEGRITHTLKARFKVKPFISANVLSVKKEDVRTGVAWDGREWKLRQPREWKVAQPAGELTLLLTSAFCCRKRTANLSQDVLGLTGAKFCTVLFAGVVDLLTVSTKPVEQTCVRLLHTCGLQHLLESLCPSALSLAT